MRSASGTSGRAGSSSIRGLPKGLQPKATTVNAAALQEHFAQALKFTATSSAVPSRKLTLAQRRGLMQAPKPKLTAEEWQEVESRSKGRKDSHIPCVICREAFKNEDQILLSCSHVFHRACINSFEKFSQSKSCPLCRQEMYQKKVIKEGARLWKHRCATKIQATWLGFRARKLYHAVLDAIVPTDPVKRRLFFGRRLTRITDQMLKAQKQERAAVDQLFSEIENSLALSRAVFGSTAAPVDELGIHSPDTARRNFVDWNRIKLKAQARNDPECPICLVELTSSRERALLSCSHVFHYHCIHAFERFHVGEPPFLCPCCRMSYTKISWRFE